MSHNHCLARWSKVRVKLEQLFFLLLLYFSPPKKYSNTYQISSTHANNNNIKIIFTFLFTSDFYAARMELIFYWTNKSWRELKIDIKICCSVPFFSYSAGVSFTKIFSFFCFPFVGIIHEGWEKSRSCLASIVVCLFFIFLRLLQIGAIKYWRPS